MFDITGIIETLFAVIGIIIAVVIIPYIKSKTTRNQQMEINDWVKIAVTAAEQIFVGSGRGIEKKRYVVSWLYAHGIIIDEDKVDGMIEAAVYDLKNGVITIIDEIELPNGSDDNDLS